MLTYADMPSHTPTILISDDDPRMVRALARLARGAGFSFLSDTTSEHVLEIARLQKPDVIVLDVNQPIDGRDLLAALKKDPETRSIRVLMLSGNEDQFLRHQCFELGAEDYLVKPFDPLFMTRLARLCGVSGDGPSTSYTAPPAASRSSAS